MWQDDTEEAVRPNWMAILSFTGSVICSLGIWVGLIRVIEHFVK